MKGSNTVTIQHFEVRKKDIAKIKRFFKVKDDAEALRKALDVATGKIELENIFEKHKGTNIRKVYA